MTDRKAKIAEIGNITMVDGPADTDEKHQYEMAMVIQFDSREALHEALQTGHIEVEPWK
jgi:hypothetical protein